MMVDRQTSARAEEPGKVYYCTVSCLMIECDGVCGA